MNDPHDHDGALARTQVVQLVRVVHHYLAQTDLAVRERVEVRRDLAYLISESHRHVFRRHVAAEVCASVLSEVAHALPQPTRDAMLTSCEAHLGWVRAADEGGRT